MSKFICRICGRPVDAQHTVISEDGNKVWCHSCYTALYSCSTCIHSAECGFSNPDDPAPLVVMETVQHGPMVAQRTVPNPERIKRYCSNCICNANDFGCLKQIKDDGICCNNYKEIGD